MQSSFLWSDVINYLTIDSWVSGILDGLPPHIHQASSLQLRVEMPPTRSPQPLQHGLLLRYNTDSYLHVKWREPGGMHYAPRCFSILAYVRFYIV